MNDVVASLVDALAERHVQEITAITQFNAECDATFQKGMETHGEAFQTALQNCRQFGLLEEEIIADALAAEAPHEVLLALGTDPDLAMRLKKLPPSRRVAEFAKLALKRGHDGAQAAGLAEPQGHGQHKNNRPAHAGSFDPMDPNISDEEWHRQQDERERRMR